MTRILAEDNDDDALLRRFCDLKSVLRAQELLEARPRLLTASSESIDALLAEDRSRWHRVTVLRNAADRGVEAAFWDFSRSEGSRFADQREAIDELLRAQSPADLRALLTEAPELVCGAVEDSLEKLIVEAAASDPQDWLAIRSRWYLVHSVRRVGVDAGLVQANLMYAFMIDRSLFRHVSAAENPRQLVPLLDFVGDLCCAETPLAEKAALVADPARLDRDAWQLVKGMQQQHPPDEVAESLHQTLHLIVVVESGASTSSAALRAVTAGNIIAARTEEAARRYAVEYVDVFGPADPGVPVVGRDLDDDHPVEARFSLINEVAEQRYEYLLDVVSQLCAATSVKEARSVLLDHPASLSFFAEKLVDAVAEEATADEAPAARRTRALLRESRELGVERALMNLGEAFAREAFGKFVAERGTTASAGVEPGASGLAAITVYQAMDEVLRGSAPLTSDDIGRVLNDLEALLAVTAPGADLHIDLLNRKAFLLRVCFGLGGSAAHLDEAAAALDAALRVASGSERELLDGNLGDLLVQRYEATGDETDLDRALALLNTAVIEEPASSGVERSRRLLSLAHALFAVGARGGTTELTTCVEVLEQARSLTPGSLDVHHVLGLALAARSGRLGEPGDLTQAVVHLRAAISLAETRERTVLPSYNLALCLIEIGSAEARAEARDVLERCLEIESERSAGADSLRSSSLTDRVSDHLGRLAADGEDLRRGTDLGGELLAGQPRSGR